MMGVLKNARCGWLLAAAVATTLCGGCAWLYGARPVEEVTPPAVRMEATRTELLLGIEQRALLTQTLTATVQMWAYNEGMVVPATLADNMRYRAGKEYNKKFERAQVNAALMMKRAEGGARKLMLTGTVVGPNLSVRLLGVNDAFWISLPNIEQPESKDTRGIIYVGESQRVAPRRADLFSIRPQDVWDLMFTDEVLMKDNVVTYMETWPDFYVINFLLTDSPERIFSKMWISRIDLTMTVHQIFDGTGRILAEARFNAYEPAPNPKGRGPVLVPTQVMMLWPRDRLVLSMELENIKVNEAIHDKWFEPVEPRQYRVQKIDDIPASSAPPAVKGR